MTAVASIKSHFKTPFHQLFQNTEFKPLITSSLKDPFKKHLLSDFLPYNFEEKKHSKLADGLKEYKMLLIATEQALMFYFHGELSNFDSLVGENSCQIRATMLSLITKFSNIDIKNLLSEVRSKIKVINNFTEENSSATFLKEFVEENNLHLKLNHSEAFLISSYILTQVRVILPPNPSKRIVRNESTVTRKVKEISPVGSTFARELVKKLRNFVSSASVIFIQEAADLLPIPKSFSKMVSDKYCVEYDKFGRLKCLPSFWYTFVLIQYSLALELPLLLIVNQIASDRNHEVMNEVSLYFKVDKGRYVSTSRNEFSENTPALVILGSCCRKFADFPPFEIWKKELLKYNPSDLLLAYAAAHRQYPDEEKDILVSESNCEAFSYYRSKAHEVGCSLKNPSLFFLVHAYCERIKFIDCSFLSNTAVG